MNLEPWYYVKNSQNWISKRLNTNYINIIDYKKDDKVATITTKQWRTPNSGFIKVYLEDLEKGYLKYLYDNDVAFITDEKTNEIFLLRILTEEECFKLMGFDNEDWKRIEEMNNLIRKDKK